MIRVFPARLVRVVDGDTFVVRLDLGVSVFADQTVRLYGVDTPERGDGDRWSDARFRSNHLMRTIKPLMDGESWPLLVSTAQTPSGTQAREKYGRLLARVTLVDGKDLATTLVAEGHALPWDGKGAHPKFE